MAKIIARCCSTGYSVGDITYSQHENVGGTFYWKATRPIEAIFGSEVEGDLVGYGKTKEIALEHLMEEQRKFSESLWV